jgi:hypothetical protein
MSEIIPKLFVSYSWSNPDHEQRVLRFAEDLVSQGIDVILDKWHLQPGHDANAFMESMVTDPSVTKVIMVCDEGYAAKSDRRTGGAGTEAQIITPEIYAQAKQDKFAAVVFDRDSDGKAFLPTYYQSRIYFDLSDPSNFGAEFDKVVRWAWGKQLHVRPEIGAAPKFLVESINSGRIVTSVAHRRAMDAIRNRNSHSGAMTAAYLDIVARGLESFRIKTAETNKQTFDDLVVESIEEFLPYRNELIELFVAVAQFEPGDSVIEAIHRFFEKCIPYYQANEHITSYGDWDFDNYRFIVHELFLYCIGTFIMFEKFQSAAYFINNEYFWRDRHNRENTMHSFVLFREYMKSLEYRNSRLKLSRLSVRADMLHTRNQGTAVDFQFVMAADFILYLRGWKPEEWTRWWPETLLYVGRFGGAFEMFARSKSKRYFAKIMGILNITSKEDFVKLIDAITADSQRLPKWQFDSLNPRSLIALDQISTAA